MLLQIDGNHHAWREDRDPRFVLLLAVYDATVTVANAQFRPEDTQGCFLLMEDIIHSCGIPLVNYGERHGVFKFNGKPSSHPTGGSGPVH